MKRIVLLVATMSFISVSAFSKTEKLASLEKDFHVKIGVYAIDTNKNKVIGYRANERFPIQSTFKVMGVSDLLKRNMTTPQLMQEKITYKKEDLAGWSPVTKQHIINGATLYELAAAAISYSDNTAINLIMKKIGGPKGVTAFAHAIGNHSFNIEHYEPNLNSNPKNKQDTSTPKDMAISLQKLILGNVLAEPQRKQLLTWMRNNTTGYKRIRAGVPIGWVVADKTGSGSYGIANDIGIIWSPVCKPIVLAIYTVHNKPDAKRQDTIIARTTNIVLNKFAKNDSCF